MRISLSRATLPILIFFLLVSGCSGIKKYKPEKGLSQQAYISIDGSKAKSKFMFGNIKTIVEIYEFVDCDKPNQYLGSIDGGSTKTTKPLDLKSNVKTTIKVFRRELNSFTNTMTTKERDFFFIPKPNVRYKIFVEDKEKGFFDVGIMADDGTKEKRLQDFIKDPEKVCRPDSEN